MDRTELAFPIGRNRRLARAAVWILTLALLSGTVFAACSGAHGSTASSGAMATMSGDGPDAAASTDGMAEASAAWDARPAFVRGNSQTEEAYAYALYHPQIVQWMPCYCGCGASGHRSNLDCYLMPLVAGAPIVFEEHASYCDTCVKTTLLTKRLISEGRTLREIRSIVDQTFGGSVPGTPTELPPA